MTTRTAVPAAVLWDMDGTLIDSEPYWIAAETALAARFGVEWTHADGLDMVGRPLPESGALLQQRGIDLEVSQIVGELLDDVSARVRENVPWQRDARALLAATLDAAIPCALVTMSYATMADAFLEDVPAAFSTVVTGDMVTRGKPDPESYLLAADRLGVDIGDCVAIEDSPPGVAAAHASGAATLAVRRVVPLDPPAGVTLVDSLDGWDVQRLADLSRIHRERAGGE